MAPSVVPNDNWDKDKYWGDVKWYKNSMTKVNQMKLTQKQRGCCRNITKAITESISILENSKKRLSRTDKQRLDELVMLRHCNFAGFFKE